MKGIAQRSRLDVQQSDRTRWNFTTAMAAGPVAETRTGAPVTFMHGDFSDPQLFENHPVIKQILDAPVAGVETAWPGLPGRTPTTWDGEPGPSSPASQ